MRKHFVRQPYRRATCGVGYTGLGEYSVKTHPRIYHAWASMLKRCYSSAVHKRAPTYIGCTVSKRWQCFQNFAYDYLQMVGSDKGWELDKDILIPGNKHYSRRRCVLVPPQINTLFLRGRRTRTDLPLGVTVHKGCPNNPYIALCHVRGKQIHVGSFNNPRAAFRAYRKVKEQEIMRIANEFKNQIDPRVYDALTAYRVKAEVA